MNDETIRETVEDGVAAAGKDITSALPKSTDLMGEAKSFLERAQEAIEDAVETTVEAVKENPLTAAAIAAGVVAAATGAAYGVSALLSDDKTADDKQIPAVIGHRTAGAQSTRFPLRERGCIATVATVD